MILYPFDQRDRNFKALVVRMVSRARNVKLRSGRWTRPQPGANFEFLKNFYHHRQPQGTTQRILQLDFLLHTADTNPREVPLRPMIHSSIA